MTAAKNSDTALEILCRSAIKQNLGDLSGLPNELAVQTTEYIRRPG